MTDGCGCGERSGVKYDHGHGSARGDSRRRVALPPSPPPPIHTPRHPDRFLKYRNQWRGDRDQGVVGGEWVRGVVLGGKCVVRQ